jgi:hypothetical protein
MPTASVPFAALRRKQSNENLIKTKNKSGKYTKLQINRSGKKG